jgi:hypothetical protein
MFKAALEILKGLSDSDITSFASLESPDDATVAVLRAVLSAAGQVGVQDQEGDQQWPDSNQTGRCDDRLVLCMQPFSVAGLLSRPLAVVLLVICTHRRWVLTGPA